MRESGIRDVLLQRSLAHAVATVPAYQHLRDVAQAVVSPLDLARLPVTCKQEILLNPEKYLSNKLRTSFLQHSGGTSGNSIVIHRCQEEVDFRRSYFSALGQMATGTHAPLTITINGRSFHGKPLHEFDEPTFELDLRDWVWLSQLVDIVSRPHEYACCSPRPAILVGLEPDLRFVTAHLMKLGFDFASSKITSIVSIGDLITSFKRAWYESTWKIPLEDRFSLSEIAAGASRCKNCDGFQFDPSIVWEVIDLSTRAPVSSGVGLLVVTTLVPFVQRHPFLRYNTEDLVELKPCSVCGGGFHLLGRMSDCIVDVSALDNKLYLSAARLSEVIERCSQVAFSNVHSGNSGATGFPFVRVRDQVLGDRRSIVVEFRPVYSPLFHRTHDEQVCSELRGQLIDVHPDLNDEISAGHVLFQVRSASENLRDELRPGGPPTQG